jgi:hypothetical protein
VTTDAQRLALWLLAEIAAHIREHDRLAAIAASRSKWSVQDYHMCLLYHYRRLWYRIRRATHSKGTLPETPYAKRLRALRRDAFNIYKDSNPDHRRRLRSCVGKPRVPPRTPTVLPPLPYYPPALPPPS